MPFSVTDVVSIKKIHYNVFFKYIKDPVAFGNKFISENNIAWICKRRPAIILKRIIKKHGKNKDKYLLIPLTSKPSIDGWVGGMDLFRIEFNHQLFGGKPSYLMIEAMTLVNEQDIEGLYNFGTDDDVKHLDMTTSLQRWVNQSIKKKLDVLFNAAF